MRIAFSIIIALILAGCSFAQTATGSVDGAVVDWIGNALPKAQVILESVKSQGNNSGFYKTVVSDNKGLISILDVPPGFYIVTASAPKFDSTSQSIFVNAGDRANADMMLSGSGGGTAWAVTSGPCVCSSEIIIFIGAEKSDAANIYQKVPVFVDGERIALISPSGLFKVTIINGNHRISFDKSNTVGSIETNFRPCQDYYVQLNWKKNKKLTPESFEIIPKEKFYNNPFNWIEKSDIIDKRRVTTN